MRWLLVLFLIAPTFATGQSRTVLPEELRLEVTVEAREFAPLEREMVLLTIRGTYRRHITRETLVQPDLEGFNWSQLGPDTWREERIDGKKVKTFIRRMAVYPERPGELTIGAFRHRLTLTDEGDDWFEHEIQSDPVLIRVEPAPVASEWWFPVRDLKVSDEWSNAPDQLQPGEGVLRVIRLEALGATPEMIPPMPDLTSPSAMIFPHPEKRLVELTPHGPLTYAFWRWTIRPGNDVSGVVEPISFEYFNTTLREERSVTISAQRVAYGVGSSASPVAKALPSEADNASDLPSSAFLTVFLFTFVISLIVSLRGLVWAGTPGFPLWDRQKLALRKAMRRGHVGEIRAALVPLTLEGEKKESYRNQLADFDRAIFSKEPVPEDFRPFAR